MILYTNFVSKRLTNRRYLHTYVLFNSKCLTGRVDTRVGACVNISQYRTLPLVFKVVKNFSQRQQAVSEKKEICLNFMEWIKTVWFTDLHHREEKKSIY